MCYSIGTCFILPGYFSTRIMQTTNSSSIYYWVPSDFGLSLFFKFYVLLVFLVESVIPVIFLLIMNIITIRKFRKFIANKGTLTTAQNESGKAEERFTKWTLVLTAICLSTRILDLLSGIFNRLRIYQLVVFTKEQLVLVALFKQTALLLLFCSHACECLIYLKVDRNLKELMMELLHIKKVNF